MHFNSQNAAYVAVTILYLPLAGPVSTGKARKHSTTESSLFFNKFSLQSIPSASLARTTTISAVTPILLHTASYDDDVQLDSWLCCAAGVHAAKGDSSFELFNRTALNLFCHVCV